MGWFLYDKDHCHQRFKDLVPSAALSASVDPMGDAAGIRNLNRQIP